MFKRIPFVKASAWEPQANELVASGFAAKDYRPTVVCCVLDYRGRVLLVQSVKGESDWHLPQGGVEPSDENLIVTGHRELLEECGIAKERLSFVGYGGHADVAAPAGRVDKRGFTKGKRYLALWFDYDGTDSLALQKSELKDYVWKDSSDVAAHLSGVRKEKRDLILAFLGLAGD